MRLTIDTPVGKIAAEHPRATRAFARHRIDYCCGGGRTLAAACEARGLDANSVLEEVEQEIGSSDGDDLRRWNTASPEAIIAHIVATYHTPLREELPRLEAMARKVAAVHGDRRPETLPLLSATVSALRADLERHMSEEEDVVFPRITGGGEAEDVAPRFADLEHDHEEAAVALEQIRRLADDFEIPGEACATWRALWHGLADLERTMHEHVHLENNILFPRVMAG